MQDKKKGMTQEELATEVDRILLKKTRKEELTAREERIVAYEVTASRCSCGVRTD